ncbi:hypothetical protein GCM10027569_17630 [Flindersiella endophytica]
MVAGQARDVTDYASLLSMLDLDDPAIHPTTLSRRLAAYIGQVAVAIGVPADATEYEVGDTAKAYLHLDQRSAVRSGHDLILAWDERLGWYLASAATPTTKAPVVMAYLDGDIVPPPAAVARFVAGVVAGRGGSRIRPVQPSTKRDVLAAKLTAACPSPSPDHASDASR